MVPPPFARPLRGGPYTPGTLGAYTRHFGCIHPVLRVLPGNRSSWRVLLALPAFFSHLEGGERSPCWPWASTGGLAPMPNSLCHLAALVPCQRFSLYNCLDYSVSLAFVQGHIAFLISWVPRSPWHPFPAGPPALVSRSVGLKGGPHTSRSSISPARNPTTLFHPSPYHCVKGAFQSSPARILSWTQAYSLNPNPGACPPTFFALGSAALRFQESRFFVIAETGCWAEACLGLRLWSFELPDL